MPHLIRRGLRRAYGFARATAWPALTSPLGRLRSRRQIISSFPADGAIHLGPRVAVFCHFDGAGKVRPRVFAYLQALRAEGFSIVFVTNSGAIDADHTTRLRVLCAGIIVRRNVGYDFGAWREALEHAGLPRSDTCLLLLVNDSVFGPFRPLLQMLGRMSFETADIWGLTDSLQSRYHLQSFFLAIGQRALSSQVWREFWSGVRPAPSKYWIIRQYEIGFTRTMQHAGLRCAAVWPYASLLAAIPALDATPRIGDVLHDANTRRIAAKAARGAPLNPSSDLWRELLAAGFPFIKRELLRDNPARVPDVADWHTALRDVAGPDAVGSISDELAASDHKRSKRRNGERRRR